RVVDDDGNAIGGDGDVALDRIALPASAFECRERVLPAFAIEVMQAAMRDRPLGQPVEPGVSGGHQASSRMASTSTGAFSGSEAMPTAERACWPRSPKTSMNSCEAPLATRCWSVKPGAE